MLVCRIIPSALPSLSFLLLNYLLITPWIVMLLNTAHQTLNLCQRSFWLVQFVQLPIAAIVQTCSWLLMWCGKALMEQPFLESTTQEQQVSRRPLGCFHKLKGLFLQFGNPLWAWYLLVVPSSFATLFYCSMLLKLLLLAELIACGLFFFLGSWALLRESADLSCMENLLEILEIL